MTLEKILSGKVGFFLTIEGIHGAGKSTIASMLKKDFEKLGYKVVIVEDQKASWLAKELRKIHIERDVKVDPIAEMLLILAARRQNIVDYFIPYLQEGYIVIGERYNDATIAFQGFGRGLPLESIDYITKFIEQGLQPKLTILLDAPAEIALARIKGKKHRFEREALAFHEKVRQGYLFQARRYPERIIVMDATRSIEEVYRDVWNVVYSKIKEFEEYGGYLAKS